MISPLQAHLSETLTSLKFATKVGSSNLPGHLKVISLTWCTSGSQHPYWNGEKTDKDAGRLTRISSMTAFTFLRLLLSGVGFSILPRLSGVFSGIVSGVLDRGQGSPESTCSKYTNHCISRAVHLLRATAISKSLRELVTTCELYFQQPRSCLEFCDYI